MKTNLRAEDYAALGAFRYAMRKFLRFSKDVLATGAKLRSSRSITGSGTVKAQSTIIDNNLLSYELISQTQKFRGGA